MSDTKNIKFSLYFHRLVRLGARTIRDIILSLLVLFLSSSCSHKLITPPTELKKPVEYHKKRRVGDRQTERTLLAFFFIGIEEEIKNAFYPESEPFVRGHFNFLDAGTDEEIANIAKTAAEVAKKYIDKAFDAGAFYGNPMAQTLTDIKAWDKEQFLKKHGII